jgi:pilus assembly protein CpaB
MKNIRGVVMMGIALVLAIAAVLVAARWINAKASNATNKVAVARVDIALGSRITPETVKMVDWPANAMPPGAFTDLKMLEARVARTTIQLGEPLMETKLAPPGTQGGLSAVVAQGKRAMTVRVNDVVGVAGFAMPGNFVDILVNTQGEKSRQSNDDRDPSISKIVLEHILVLAIAQEASRDDTKAKVVNAVTLELTPEQTETLDLARSVGTLSLVLRNQVDPETAPTGGATKTSLLGLAPAPAPAPAPTVAKAAPRPAPVVRHTVSQPRLADKVEVIKGLDRSTQQF